MRLFWRHANNYEYSTTQRANRGTRNWRFLDNYSDEKKKKKTDTENYFHTYFVGVNPTPNPLGHKTTLSQHTIFETSTPHPTSTHLLIFLLFPPNRHNSTVLYTSIKVIPGYFFLWRPWHPLPPQTPFQFEPIDVRILSFPYIIKSIFRLFWQINRDESSKLQQQLQQQ